MDGILSYARDMPDENRSMQDVFSLVTNLGNLYFVNYRRQLAQEPLLQLPQLDDCVLLLGEFDCEKKLETLRLVCVLKQFRHWMGASESFI